MDELATNMPASLFDGSSNLKAQQNSNYALSTKKLNKKAA